MISWPLSQANALPLQRRKVARSCQAVQIGRPGPQSWLLSPYSEVARTSAIKVDAYYFDE